MDQDLLAAIRALETRLAALERQVTAALSLEGALRRRGWRLGPHSGVDQVLLPRPDDPERVDRFYRDLHHYHFRRVLQEAAEQGTLPADTVRRLEARWGPRAVTRTLGRLTDYGLLERRRDGLAMTAARIHTFGETLEWFVAQVFAREFLAPAAWDARIREIRAGGDFDVLVVLDGRLGYVECKGSPPYNVPAAALTRYLDRIRRLNPDFTILVLDTGLRIDRNIIDNLRRLLPDGAGRTITRAAEGIHRVEAPLPFFIVTSRRSLVANLGRCLRLVRRPAEEGP